MHCPYCFYTENLHLRRGKELKKKDWYKVAEIISDYYKGYNLRFHLAGGEVFTKAWVPEFCKWILTQGIPLSIVTNGLYIPEQIYTDPVFRKDLFAISFSIDGFKRIHELTRKDYNKVIANFEKFLKSKILPGTMTTVHKKSLAHMLEFHIAMNEIGKRYGCIIIMELQPVISFFRKKIKNFSPLKLDLYEYLREGIRVHEYSKRHLKYINTHWRFVGELWRFNHREDMCLNFESLWLGCTGGIGFGVIANGDIVPCEMDKPIDNILGNLNEKTLIRAIERSEKKYMPRVKCLRCSYKFYCGMCRLSPVVHGYCEGFGYSDCQKFYKDIVSFYDLYWKTGKIPSL